MLIARIHLLFLAPSHHGAHNLVQTISIQGHSLYCHSRIAVFVDVLLFHVHWKLFWNCVRYASPLLIVCFRLDFLILTGLLSFS